MKSIGLFVREKIACELRERIQTSRGCLFISFSKITALAFNALRNDLNQAGTKIFVTKNSLIRKVFKELGTEELDGFVAGETGLVLIYDDDVVKPCKILVDFLKENEALQIQGGFLQDKKITSDQVKSLAKLPSREILLAMALQTMAAPLTGFLSSLNQIILKFVWLVEEIKKKKHEGG